VGGIAMASLLVAVALYVVGRRAAAVPAPTPRPAAVGD
jgi:hypothetical protein